MLKQYITGIPYIEIYKMSLEQINFYEYINELEIELKFSKKKKITIQIKKKHAKKNMSNKNLFVNFIHRDKIKQKKKKI